MHVVVECCTFCGWKVKKG